jgi:AraC-like DNA-binding protein
MGIALANILEFKEMVRLLDEAAPRRDVDRALFSAGLSRNLLDEPGGFLPYRLEAIVLESVSRALGDPFLGARLSRNFSYAAYDGYARYVLGASNLFEALLRGSRAIPYLNTGHELVFRKSGDHLVVGRRTSLDGVIGRRHLDEAVPFIIGVVAQYYCGEDWRPDWIELQADSDASGFEMLTESAVLSDGKMPAVAIGLDDLFAPNPVRLTPEETVTFADLPHILQVSPPQTFSDVVKEALRVQFRLGDISQNAVSEHLSIGSRSLQRLLMLEGVTFRELKARFVEERARALLAETDTSIEAIARALGYAETNSFRRVFQSWTDFTPAPYRASYRRNNPN